MAFDRPLTEERGRARGRRTEALFFAAVRDRQWRPPYWWHDERRATADEDKKGVDAFVATDVGIVPVQIKSSKEGMRRDQHRYGVDTHCVLVLDSRWPLARVQAKIIDTVTCYRRHVLINDESTVPEFRKARA